MKNLIIKIAILVTFILGLTASRCQTYVRPCEFYVGVQNRSNIGLSALKLESIPSAKILDEWLLTDKQYIDGDLFSFAKRDKVEINTKFRVQLINISGKSVVDTILQLDGAAESTITYSFKYNMDKTLELETIIKPL